MPLVRENATPLYRQIAMQLRQDIAEGLFERTGKLPSEAELRERFSVSRVTVRQALTVLVESGLVEQRKGKGTYLIGRDVRYELDTLRSFHESLCLQGFDARMRLLRFEIRTPPGPIGAILGHGGACLFLERLHLIGEEPIAVGRSFLPAQFADIPRAEADRTPTYVLFNRFFGQSLDRVHLTLGAQAADDELACLLKISDTTALLRMERVSFFTNNTPAECSVFFIRPERYRFTLNSHFVAE
ncbi:MAG: GntR family transcriptional regulator [Acetobacter sp.]|uniref:GntR family transcriptional regulator n=1 Tax=Acetobacter sp. TaxID=440 RepID=UPI0039EC3187